MYCSTAASVMSPSKLKLGFSHLGRILKAVIGVPLTRADAAVQLYEPY